jgi:hypothetical protein
MGGKELEITDRVEIEEYLDYARYSPSGRNSGNSRYGHSS